MKGTAIYGGSFDPVHKGHTAVMRHLSEVFDKVIVMPGYISPFKQENFVAPAAERLKMLQLAVKEEKLNVIISDYEIKKGGVSYTIDTVRNFAVPFGNLYFVLGSENLASLSKWREFNELKQLVSFYVIPRKEYPQKLCNIGGLSDSDASVRGTISNFSAPDISSSLVKTALAFDCVGISQRYAGEFLSPSVQTYIRSQKLYVRFNKLVHALKEFKLTKERISHSFYTAKYAVRLAKIHSEDVDKSIIAAILHDVGKEATPEMLSKHGIAMPVLPSMPASCRHGYIGAEIAKYYCKIEDEDILNAIRYHTTCRTTMSKLEKIIALSDYLEETRGDSPVLDKIRTFSETNLDKAMYAMLDALIRHLKGSKKQIFGLTKVALRHYAAKNKTK